MAYSSTRAIGDNRFPEPTVDTVIYSPNGYLINNTDRGHLRFRDMDYYIFNNAFFEFRPKHQGREPSFTEFQTYCARKGLAGFFEGKGTTFPDDSMRGIYERLCGRGVDRFVEKYFQGKYGNCAPLAVCLRTSNPANVSGKKALEEDRIYRKEVRQAITIERRLERHNRHV